MSNTILTPQGLRIECASALEKWRAQTLMTKEAGTIRWLSQLGRADVLYDVGANIGLYSLIAAKQGAKVYAFEPHAANIVSLLHHVRVNHMTRVTVLSSALHEEETFLPFHYFQAISGSSGSQLGHTQMESGDAFDPVAVELKHATTVDRLVDDRHLDPPTAVKIDVDGNEPSILRGMRKVLGLRTLRTLQVEMHPASDAEIVGFLDAHGFILAERHYTQKGQQAIDAGKSPDQVPHNAVFTRRETNG